MKGVRRAVIDIGANSVKLLVADVQGAEVRPVLEESRQTRLGQGFYQMQRLQAGPIAKTAAVAALSRRVLAASSHGALAGAESFAGSASAQRKACVSRISFILCQAKNHLATVYQSHR
jgi:exopolyphosphatase/guanosine-5'-triphosphate,3'-diphosphate pyrophosphatase